MFANALIWANNAFQTPANATICARYSPPPAYQTPAQTRLRGQRPAPFLTWRWVIRTIPHNIFSKYSLTY